MKRPVLFALAACTLLAQSDPRYVRFSPSDTKGALYAPDSGPAPTIGVLVIHRTANFMETLACTELSKRGFLVLCMNPRSDNNEAAVWWNDIALDVKTGVEFLRARPGIEKVVLWGHSGGGPTTTFYQAVAENGTSYCDTPEKIVPCGESLAGMPPADGVILVDAHPGNSVNVLRSINPAVLNDEEVIERNAEPKLDPSLDALNPANGYRLGGSHYTAEFKTRYFAAQARRMNKLIGIAMAKRAAMRAGAYRYSDDDYFPIVQSSGWRLMQQDVSIHGTTAQARRLLRNDGSIVEEIVRGVRVPSASAPNSSFSNTRMYTVRSFLSTNAIRAKDSMDEIDWCSSNNSVPCAVQSISVPILIAPMGGYYFVRDNEIHYELAKSEDKEFIVIEGAVHSQQPCTACETTPGQYSNTVENFYNHARDWMNARF
jgi:pimeloyl-ACP methyl ester carboxylesterase